MTEATLLSTKPIGQLWLAVFMSFLLCCSGAFAKGTPPKPIPPVLAQVPMAVQQQATMSPTCFFRLPGTLAQINLYLVTKVAVYGKEYGDYRTRLYWGNSYDEIELKPGVDVNFHLLLIEQRLQECKQGK